MGCMSFGMVKGIVKWGMDEDDCIVFWMLCGVKKVEFVIYDIYGEEELCFFCWFEVFFDWWGWEILVCFCDGGEFGWIVYCMDG